MKEIGGYFGLEQLISNEYHAGLIALNSGRNALLYALKAKKIKKVYLPRYLCVSIKELLDENGFDFIYYEINKNFMPILLRHRINEGECVYIVNYFGQLTNNSIAFLKDEFNRIIVDNTHAFFQKPIEGIDTIYSCRKFFGIPDGAYLSTEARLDEDIKVDISRDRMAHILGRFEGTASNYYKNYISSESSLKKVNLKYMSNLTRNILGAIEYKRVREARNRNYGYLENALGKLNMFSPLIPDGPFAYPFYVEDGIEIRRLLADKKIYIPTLWPDLLIGVPTNSIEYKYAANILPLPVDQRYMPDDMEKIVEEIRKCIN